MKTESQKYQNGRSGFGGADYSSASWRAGDAERQRVENQTRRANISGSSPYAVPILLFVVFCTWFAVDVSSRLGGEYNAVAGIVAFFSSLALGLYIRKILLGIVVATVGLFILGVIGTGIYQETIGKDSETSAVNQQTAVTEHVAPTESAQPAQNSPVTTDSRQKLISSCIQCNTLFGSTSYATDEMKQPYQEKCGQIQAQCKSLVPTFAW